MMQGEMGLEGRGIGEQSQQGAGVGEGEEAVRNGRSLPA